MGLPDHSSQAVGGAARTRHKQMNCGGHSPQTLAWWPLIETSAERWIRTPLCLFHGIVRRIYTCLKLTTISTVLCDMSFPRRKNDKVADHPNRYMSTGHCASLNEVSHRAFPCITISTALTLWERTPSATQTTRSDLQVLAWQHHKSMENLRTGSVETGRSWRDGLCKTLPASNGYLPTILDAAHLKSGNGVLMINHIFPS